MDILIVSHHKSGAVLGMHVGNAVARALGVQCLHHTDGVHREPARFSTDAKAPCTVQTDWHSGFSAASHNGWSRNMPTPIQRGKAVRIPEKVPYFDAAQRARENGRDVRIVHLCRHPKEIVCSSQRYHSKCSEVWCINSGYQELLRTMNTLEGIDFEMHNVAGTIVSEMLAWLRINDVDWISHIPMHIVERWDETASSKIAEKANVDHNVLSRVFENMRGDVLSTKSSHGTRKNNEQFTFAKTFDDESHKEFETLFPAWRHSLWEQ